jgi:hypothetical protein
MRKSASALNEASQVLKKAGFKRARIVAVLTKEGEVRWQLTGTPIDLCWMASALHEASLNMVDGDADDTNGKNDWGRSA